MGLIDSIRGILNNSSDKYDKENVEAIAEQAEGDVTADELVEVRGLKCFMDIRNPEEVIDYIWIGREIDVDEGDTRGKFVHLAVTDERIIIIDQGVTGANEFVIDYSDIESANYENGAISKSLVLVTPSNSYEVDMINIRNANKNDEAEDIVRAIRNRISKTSNDNTNDRSKPDSEDDALDKLDQLKQLHEEEVITDKEFDNKKSELLEDV